MELLVLSFVIIAIITFIVFVYDVLDYSKKIKNNESKKSKVIIFSILLLSLCAFCIAIALNVSKDLLNNSELVKSDYTKVGAYGDLVGGIMNPVIAFVGIIAASLAFYAQFRANQQVKDQFIKQEKKDYIQNFENKLFKLIEFQNHIVQDIDMNISIFNDDILNEIIANNPIEKDKYFRFHEDNFEGDNNLIFKEIEIRSRDSFKFSFELLDNILSISNELFNTPELISDNFDSEYLELFTEKFTKRSISYEDIVVEDYFSSIYNLIFSKINIDLGHYYRNLYRIFKIIDEAIFSVEEQDDFRIKYQYASIVRSQLSDYEIYFLFYNGISENGASKFKKLIEDYSLLKIIPIDNKSFEFNVYKELYDKKAFGYPNEIRTIS